MKILTSMKDGGNESTVWGLFLIEMKSLFSIALLRFENGSREAYHDHAFSSISWVLKGKLQENMLDDKVNEYTPSFKPICTSRTDFHKVVSIGRTWVLTFRGPWKKFWHEFLPETKEFVLLTEGRTEVCRTTRCDHDH